MATEFIVGLQTPKPPQQPGTEVLPLTPDSNLKEVVLITDVMKKITLISSRNNVDNCQILSAIVFNDVNNNKLDVRLRDLNEEESVMLLPNHHDDDEEVMFEKHVQWNDGGIDTTMGGGMNHNCRNHALRSSMKLSNSPFVDEIILQQTCFSTAAVDGLSANHPSSSSSQNLYSRRITYIKIRIENRWIEMGTLRNVSDSVEGNYIVLPKERVIGGKCMISGVGMHHSDIICLQVIHIPDHSTNFNILPSSSLLKIVKQHHDHHLYTYTPIESTLGYSVNLQSRQELPIIEQTHLVAYEKSDPDVMQIITTLFDYMLNTCSSRLAIHRVLPDLYSILERGVTQNDRNVIFATLRIQRHLRYRVRKDFRNRNKHEQEQCKFDHDPFVRLKLYKVMQCLENTFERYLSITMYQPSMNCYSAAFLSMGFSHEYFYTMIATLVFIVQIGLSFMLCLNILQSGSNVPSLQWDERFLLLSPVIAIFIIIVSYTKVKNMYATMNAYPEMKRTRLGIFHFITNGVLGLLLPIIQFLIMVVVTADDDHIMDFVLDSIVVFFILKLDDFALLLNEDGIHHLKHKFLMKDFRDAIDAIDESFFRFKDWKSARNSNQIMTESCNLKPLPPIQLTSSTRSIHSCSSSSSFSPVLLSKQEVETSVLEPVRIEFREEQIFNYPLDGWAEIASSDPIVAQPSKLSSTRTTKSERASLSFNWCDQGRGERKGKLRVRLVHAANNDTIASSPEYAISLHGYSKVEERFDLNHGLVNKCSPGSKFVVEVVVGGGGGHELKVKNFNFMCTSGLVSSSAMNNHDQHQSVNESNNSSRSPEFMSIV